MGDPGSRILLGVSDSEVRSGVVVRSWESGPWSDRGYRSPRSGRGYRSSKSSVFQSGRDRLNPKSIRDPLGSWSD